MEKIQFPILTNGIYNLTKGRCFHVGGYDVRLVLTSMCLLRNKF
jgi:hypothetical protein